ERRDDGHPRLDRRPTPRRGAHGRRHGRLRARGAGPRPGGPAGCDSRGGRLPLRRPAVVTVLQGAPARPPLADAGLHATRRGGPLRSRLPLAQRGRALGRRGAGHAAARASRAGPAPRRRAQRRPGGRLAGGRRRGAAHLGRRALRQGRA
ncbi:MAG: hypothetical protein AVDCRST_MAG06-654, partial [uncultured Nocardioides sp.]